MQNFNRGLKLLTSILICIVGFYPAEPLFAATIGRFGVQVNHPAPSNQSVTEFAYDIKSDASVTVAYTDAAVGDQRLLPVTGVFNGSGLSLTVNDRSQQIFFSSFSPANAFAFYVDGANFERRLIAYSVGNTVLDNFTDAASLPLSAIIRMTE
jgi:hypothetical protein